MQTARQPLPRQLLLFLPLFDEITQDIGPSSAMLYGLIWRACQVANGMCYLSTQSMAHRLSVTNFTVARHLKRLCEHGYIELVAPGGHGRASVYRLTGKFTVAPHRVSLDGIHDTPPAVRYAKAKGRDLNTKGTKELKGKTLGGRKDRDLNTKGRDASTDERESNTKDTKEHKGKSLGQMTERDSNTKDTAEDEGKTSDQMRERDFTTKDTKEHKGKTLIQTEERDSNRQGMAEHKGKTSGQMNEEGAAPGPALGTADHAGDQPGTSLEPFVPFVFKRSSSPQPEEQHGPTDNPADQAVPSKLPFVFEGSSSPEPEDTSSQED